MIVDAGIKLAALIDVCRRRSIGSSGLPMPPAPVVPDPSTVLSAALAKLFSRAADVCPTEAAHYAALARRFSESWPGYVSTAAYLIASAPATEPTVRIVLQTIRAMATVGSGSHYENEVECARWLLGVIVELVDDPTWSREYTILTLGHRS